MSSTETASPIGIANVSYELYLTLQDKIRKFNLTWFLDSSLTSGMCPPDARQLMVYSNQSIQAQDCCQAGCGLHYHGWLIQDTVRWKGPECSSKHIGRW